MEKICLAIVLLVSSISCNAAGWTSPLTVARAFTEDSDIIVVYTEEGGQYTPGCTINAWIFRASTDARRGRAWATILTALGTGQKIMFWFNDTCSAWSFHDATSVMLAKP